MFHCGEKMIGNYIEYLLDSLQTKKQKQYLYIYTKQTD